MNTKTVTILSGHILEEAAQLSLADLCDSCQIPAEHMIKLVEHGIISPCEGQSVRQWRFQGDSLVRVHKALNLQQDLGINLAGAALALELLDEIDELRSALYSATANRLFNIK